MNLHRLARTCPQSRALLVRRVCDEGWPAYPRCSLRFPISCNQCERAITQASNAHELFIDFPVALQVWSVGPRQSRGTAFRGTEQELPPAQDVTDELLRGPATRWSAVFQRECLEDTAAGFTVFHANASILVGSTTVADHWGPGRARRRRRTARSRRARCPPLTLVGGGALCWRLGVLRHVVGCFVRIVLIVGIQLGVLRSGEEAPPRHGGARLRRQRAERD